MTSNKPHLRVAHPPEKPLLIWDGECRFCELWVQRWRALSRGELTDQTSQQIGNRFPEIPAEVFDRSVVYVDRDGKVLTAAEAIFRSLRFRPVPRGLVWAYDKVPGFASASEGAYRLIARNRGAASVVTRTLHGEDLRPATYRRAQSWFLRGLGLVYLIAFLSLWVQVSGLIGRNGILPIGDLLSMVRDRLGGDSFSLLPTLCWFNSSDGFLNFLCGTGVVVSLLLMIGITPIICLALLFLDYLSLTVAGQTFLSFQWDILLLETGFLAFFFAPATRLWLSSARLTSTPGIGLLLLKLLLFKLMFMSGLVKLTSGDDSWWNLTALDYHYWSQPLPTVFAWFADQQPEWFKQSSVAACLVIEIVIPFFIWGPRRLRLLAAALFVLLQLAIAITGNYCFFNLLTIILCVPLIDDAGWAGRPRATASQMQGRAPASPSGGKEAIRDAPSQELRPPSGDGWLRRIQTIAAVAVLIITLPLNGWHLYSACSPDAEMPRLVEIIDAKVEPFRICSGYGLFRVMTKDRREIVVEGSSDGMDWRAYEFKWKPGDPKRAPTWCAPHQPRLDWEMWFAALSSPEQNAWFLRFIQCLLENKKDVTDLLATNPFPEHGPRYVRARFYRYRFTSAEERSRTGEWWKREELGEYLPTVSLP